MSAANYCSFGAFVPEWIEDHHDHCVEADSQQDRRELCDSDPNRMAAGGPTISDCRGDTELDVEQMKILEYIRLQNLSRPCPECQSKAVDKPLDDLRQCRACGHLWGIDDSVSLDNIIMDYDTVCGKDRCDDEEFQQVRNDVKPRLLCGERQNSRGPDMMREDDTDHAEAMPELNGRWVPKDIPVGPPALGTEKLSCYACPEVTDDFFEKKFDGDVLVRAVCPICGSIVFNKELQQATFRQERATTREEISLRQSIKDSLFMTVRKIVRDVCVHPVRQSLLAVKDAGTYVFEKAGVEHRESTEAMEKLPIAAQQIRRTLEATFGDALRKNQDAP